MDKTKEKELVKSSTFRRAYLDSVKDGPDFRVFDEMKGLVKYMPENYHIQFVQGLWHWITDASLDAPLSGISSDLISGSLPDYYTNMLIDSKKNQMLAILDRRLQTCKSFSDITSKEKSVNTRLFEIGAFYRQIMQNLKPESGKTFGRDEFMTKVIDPLKDVGTDSFRYKNRYRSVEGYVFEAIVRKGGDAASPSRHLTAARVMNVYSHFTAWLDDTELFTMANGGRMSATSKEVFDAEKPLEPGVVEPGLVAPKTEWEEVPARIYSLDDVNPNGTLPAHVNQADQYMYYVEKQITQKLPAFLEDGISPEKIPVAQNWGIKEFETWRRTEMVSNPLDPMASEPALTHDPNVPFSLATPEDWSQLEKNLNNAYYDVHQELLKKFEGIEIPNLQNYFTEYFEPDKDRVSQFRQDADMIYSGSSTKRDQLNLITSYAARFKEYLKKMVELENPGFWESAMETLGIS